MLLPGIEQCCHGPMTCVITLSSLDDTAFDRILYSLFCSVVTQGYHIMMAALDHWVEVCCDLHSVQPGLWKVYSLAFGFLAL